MTRSASRRRRLCQASALTLCSAVTLGGCATFGGNIRGDFSCAAPDGICAPSSTIDDRALAMISAEGADGDTRPAASTPRGSSRRVNRVAAPQTARIAAADPARTREKVLRIVFQPYIDERGRLHEASAVRAVVANGEWQQALGQAVVPSARLSYGSGSPETLADAVDRVDPPGGTLAAVDPGMPDPAVVAAARTRKPDPVEAIKADVANRLAPKAGIARGAATVDDAAHPPSAAVSPALPTPAEVPASGSVAADPDPGKPQVGVSAAGVQAVERVKEYPVYQGIAGSAAQGARDATAQSGAVPTAPSAGTSTVRAADFPAAVQEDN
ncbi:TraV family lipoprotein [Sphingopyxis granuli]|uniref:TraV family lipoprotein n=1 Tax=Sphingopyxis granuli TaxID=267128 RepID=UPI000832A611|nr:TraV family lipoprotein [Sphingopyxis granuli]